MVGQGRNTTVQASGNQGRTMSPPFSIIKVIHAVSIGVSTIQQWGILNITPQQELEAVECPEKRLRLSKEKIRSGNSCSRFGFVSGLSFKYYVIWVNTNPTYLVNRSGLLNPNMTYSLNG